MRCGSSLGIWCGIPQAFRRRCADQPASDVWDDAEVKAFLAFPRVVGNAAVVGARHEEQAAQHYQRGVCERRERESNA